MIVAFVFYTCLFLLQFHLFYFYKVKLKKIQYSNM